MTKRGYKIWFRWITACGIFGTLLFVFLVLVMMAGIELNLDV